MVPNFNLNFLSCMFLDIARFETTTTKYCHLVVLYEVSEASRVLPASLEMTREADLPF